MNRRAPPPNCCPTEKIEIEFSIPVYMTNDQCGELHAILNKIIDDPANQPVDGVHWVSGYGARPKWSQADAVFLNKKSDTDAPESGEPEFDDSVYYIETTARPFVSEKERKRIEEKYKK